MECLRPPTSWNEAIEVIAACGGPNWRIDLAYGLLAVAVLGLLAVAFVAIARKA